MKTPRINTRLATIAAVFASLTLALHAQVPQLINYQGRVAVRGTNFNGPGLFKFAFVNAAGTVLWTNSPDTTPADGVPDLPVPIAVSGGAYSVLLGDAALENMTAITLSVFENPDVRLRVWFDDGTHGSQLLTPDQRIAAVGYAMMAANIQDGAITSAKIASGAVGGTQLASGLTLGGITIGTFSGNLTGNATSATTAISAGSFTGSLLGDVTGNQGATVVSNIAGLTAANVALGANLANAATSANIPGAILKRDASGNFSTGTITGNLIGNATTATSFTGSLLGDVTGTQGGTAISSTTVTGKLLTGFVSAAGPVLASDSILTAFNKLNGNDALKAPLASPAFTGTILLPAGSASAAPLRLQSGTNLTTPVFGVVEFDGTSLYVTNNNAAPTRKAIAFTDSAITGSQLAPNLTLGGITVGTFSGNLAGNATTATSATTAMSAGGFTGLLAGDVTGNQGTTVVSNVGGLTAANVAMGANLANGATNASTAGTIVKRDASENFSAGTITGNLAGNATTATSAGSAANFSGNLAGDVTGTQGATVVSNVGGVTAANVAAGANLANAATTANTPNTIVKRDASGNIPASPTATAPPGMVLIPAGAFMMGNSVAADTDITNAAPISTTVSAFYMDVNEVERSKWQSVYDWATLVGGYTFTHEGRTKANNHPVHLVDWYDCVKWCNARSEREGKTAVYYTDDALTAVYRTGNVDVTNAHVKWTANGYRLPTEAEWEKAARGGLAAKRFPRGDTISQKQANYYGNTGYSYDLGPNGYNAIGSVGGTQPATSPVGSFAANGYGLNDIDGNVSEWCWDWYGTPYAGGTDPHGAATGSFRVLRGGNCYWGVASARCAFRSNYLAPANYDFVLGFRAVLPTGEP